jgi:hypothetical protein
VGLRKLVWRFWKREISFAPASPQPTHYTDYTIPAPYVTYIHVSRPTEVLLFLFYPMTETQQHFKVMS